MISMHTADRYLHESEHETFMMVSQLREIEAAEQKLSRKTIYHGGGASYGVARSHLYTRTLLNLVKRSVLSGGLILSTWWVLLRSQTRVSGFWRRDQQSETFYGKSGAKPIPKGSWLTNITMKNNLKRMLCEPAGTSG